MTFYQQIKAELSAKRENTKYFNKQFLTDYIEAKRAFIANRKNGIDNTYQLENVTYTHEFDKVYSSEFYRKNGGAYCAFLEIMTDHKEAYI